MSTPSTVATALASLLDSAPSWLPSVDHWEIAEDTDTWILSGQLAGDSREDEAFRLLAPMMERATIAHSDDGRLVTVPFEWDGVTGQVWYLRPVERYIVPERCATCPALLADAGTAFMRLGGRGAPVICVPCRDRMHEAWVREAAVRELGALPVPVGFEPPMSSEQRAAVAELIGDAKPATEQLLLEMAQQIRDRREHDHSTSADWDWYCLNASGWLGDKAPTVLRRLLDAEARVAELEHYRAAFEAQRSRAETLDRLLRTAQDRVTELEYVAPSPSCTRCYGADAERFVAQGGVTAACLVCGPSELEQMRARVAELEARLAEYERPADEDPIAFTLTETAPLTVFRASHDSIVMGLYTTREAARDHCQKLMERTSVATLEWQRDGEWREDDDGEPGLDEVEELYEYGTHPETATWEPTGYVVTPLEVAAAYDEEADE